MRRAASSAWRHGDLGLAVEAEDRHHAVADELVEPAAGACTACRWRGNSG
jgi:hypothetical protein